MHASLPHRRLVDGSAFRRARGSILFASMSMSIATSISVAMSMAMAMVHAPAAAQAPVTGDTLTLPEAVRRALSGSPHLRQAQAERSAARAGRVESWGRLLPSLELGTGLNQNQILQRTANDPVTGGIVELPDSLIRQRQTFSTSSALSASWTVFDGGRGVWGTRTANAEARAATFAVDAARARVAASVTLAYVDVLEADALREARQTELRRAEELVRVAEGRRQVGQVPEIELLQARLAEGDAQLGVLEAESAAEAARLALFQYLDVPGDADVVLVPPPVPALDRLPADEALRTCAMNGSAEMASLRASRTAAERRAQVSRLWFLPSVTVGATWVRSEFGQSREALTLTPRNEQTYYRLGFSWSPLDQPGSRMADGQRARAALRLADARLDERRASLAREVELALGQLRRARLLDERSRLNLQLAQTQLEHASERYRLGFAPILERMQAEALAKEAERQAITARYAGLRALAGLERAAGIPLLSENGTPACG